jgi:hypothetical protein
MLRYPATSRWFQDSLRALLARRDVNITKLSSSLPYSESELYRLSYRHLSAKLVQTFVYKGCRVDSAADPHGRILSF